jgi:hypothetical protein
MDDIIIIFTTTMIFFAIAPTIYLLQHVQRKNPHMAHLAFKIEMFSIQCIYPWVFHAIIYGSYLQINP